MTFQIIIKRWLIEHNNFKQQITGSLFLVDLVVVGTSLPGGYGTRSTLVCWPSSCLTSAVFQANQSFVFGLILAKKKWRLIFFLLIIVISLKIIYTS